MSLSSLGRIEEEAHIVLSMLIIVVLLWHGVWGMADEIEVNVKEAYGIPKLHFNMLTILLVLLIISLFPKILHML